MSFVARYYSTMKKARAAHKSLLAAGFRDESIALINLPAKEPEGDKATSRLGDIAAAALKAGKLLGEDTELYASQLSPGNSLVVVRPPFGRANAVGEILDRHDPLDIAPAPRATDVEKSLPWSEQSAPFSAFLGWSVLSKGATPLSDAWGLSALSDNRLSILSRWFKPLGNPHFSFSDDLLGLELLSDNSKSFSSRLGLPLLSKRSNAPWTRSFGRALLSDDPAPLSRRLGLPVSSSKRSLYE